MRQSAKPSFFQRLRGSQKAYQSYSLEYVMAQKTRQELSKSEEVVGCCEKWHDVSLKEWRMRVQLDKERLWFLSVYFLEDGRFEKFSLDKEAAEDSHYEFQDEKSIREKLYQKGDEKLYFHDILIRYMSGKGGYALLELIRPHITAQYHFY